MIALRTLFPPTPRCPSLVALALPVFLVTTSPLWAQAVAGVGADARPLPAGTVRIGIAGDWSGYDRRLDAGRPVPVLGALNVAALGTTALPQLAGAQDAVRRLSGLSSFSLSLGPLEASGDIRRSATPIAVDIGLTSRLALSVVVPYVESRNTALLILNRDGTGATVGQNPAYSSTLGTAARAVNGALLRQLTDAAAALSAAVIRCAAPTALNCDAIRANPTGVQTLLTRAAQAQTDVTTLYGSATRGGAPVVPITGSATQTAVNAQLASLRSAFVGFGITSVADSWLPAPATVINGPGAIERIAKDSAYGLDYATLGGTRRAGIGDIDLMMSWLWFNRLGTTPRDWLGAKTLGVRSVLGAGWRFGTAGADWTNDALDVPVGDGANALLIRSTTDVVFSQRVWISATVRAVQPLRDQMAMRRPLTTDSALFAPSVVGLADRTLGRHLDVEVAPRVAFNNYFGLSAGYQFRRREADRYQFAADSSAAAATLGTPSRSMHQVMVGLTFSTLASYLQQQSRWPVEVLFQHLETLGGQGGLVPVVSGDRIELRIYTGFPRR